MQDFWVAFASNPFSGLVMKGWLPYLPNGTAAQFGQLGEHGEVVQRIGIDALEAPCDYGTTPIRDH